MGVAVLLGGAELVNSGNEAGNTAPEASHDIHTSGSHFAADPAWTNPNYSFYSSI